jgi:hypothetical protein
VNHLPVNAETSWKFPSWPRRRRAERGSIVPYSGPPLTVLQREGSRPRSFVASPGAVS